MRSVEDILSREVGVSVDILAKAKERLKDDQDFGDVLGELGALTATQWSKALATSYDLPYRETLPPGAEQAELIDQIPLSFAKRYQLFPLGFWGEEVTVAIANPQEVAALDDLRVLLERYIRPFVVPKPVLLEGLNRAYDQAS